MLAPPVAFWAAWQEKRILRAGRPLAPSERQFCEQIGIRNPERIRVLSAAKIPLPMPDIILRIGDRLGIGVHSPAGMTLGHGIFALPPYVHNLPLICHELVHVRQYEQTGGIWSFLRRYLRECLYYSYYGAPMEEEARRVSCDVENRKAD